MSWQRAAGAELTDIAGIVITHLNGHQAMPVLVAGRHRLEAAKQLNWDTIACLDLSWVDANKTLLIEIDENLVRADLSPGRTWPRTSGRAEGSSMSGSSWH